MDLYSDHKNMGYLIRRCHLLVQEALKVPINILRDFAFDGDGRVVSGVFFSKVSLKRISR